MATNGGVVLFQPLLVGSRSLPVPVLVTVGVLVDVAVVKLPVAPNPFRATAIAAYAGGRSLLTSGVAVVVVAESGQHVLGKLVRPRVQNEEKDDDGERDGHERGLGDYDGPRVRWRRWRRRRSTAPPRDVGVADNAARHLADFFTHCLRQPD